YDPRRFGYIYITPNDDIRGELGIGPDPFEIGRQGSRLEAVLRRKSAPIKSILLDQHLLSGIGNIYADEALFAARIDPRTRGAAAASRIETLLSAAREVLAHAIAHGGSTVRDYRKPDGSPGSFQDHHAVYGRGGEPCLACGTVIRRIVISGRSTHFCPVCQV
ncbi:MAG: zinc finger domain-containing protein, partial [bacterium]